MPAPPAAAAEVFGAEIELADAYAAHLADVAVERGLIGPREVPRLWPRHLLNSAVAAESAAEGASVADVGSGAGLPGLVWAICRPDLRVTLIEPLLRRATFLTETVDLLDLGDRVEVVRMRAEDLARDPAARFDVVTSRAVAPWPRLLGWCAPLCVPGGRVVALKGERAEDEARTGARDARRVSRSGAVVEAYGRGVVDPPTLTIEVVIDREQRRRRR